MGTEGTTSRGRPGNTRSGEKPGGCASEPSEVAWPSRHTTPDLRLEQCLNKLAASARCHGMQELVSALGFWPGETTSPQASPCLPGSLSALSALGERTTAALSVRTTSALGQGCASLLLGCYQGCGPINLGHLGSLPMLTRIQSVFRLLRHLRGIGHSVHSTLTALQPLYSPRFRSWPFIGPCVCRSRQTLPEILMCTSPMPTAFRPDTGRKGSVICGPRHAGLPSLPLGSQSASS